MKITAVLKKNVALGLSLTFFSNQAAHLARAAGTGSGGRITHAAPAPTAAPHAGMQGFPELLPASLFSVGQAPQDLLLPAPMAAPAAPQAQPPAPSSDIFALARTAQAVSPGASRNPGEDLDHFFENAPAGVALQETAPVIASLPAAQAKAATRRFEHALKIMGQSRLFLERGGEDQVKKASKYALTYVQHNPYASAVAKLLKDSKLRNQIGDIDIPEAAGLRSSLHKLLPFNSASEKHRAARARKIFIATESMMMGLAWAGLANNSVGLFLAGLTPLFLCNFVWFGNMFLERVFNDSGTNFYLYKLKFDADAKSDFKAYARQAKFLNKASDSLSKAYQKLHAAELAQQKSLVRLWDKFAETKASSPLLTENDTLEAGMAKLLRSPNEEVKDKARQIFGHMIILEAVQSAGGAAADRASRAAKFLWLALDALPPANRAPAYAHMTETLKAALQQGQVPGGEEFLKELDAFMDGWKAAYQGHISPMQEIDSDAPAVQAVKIGSR